LPKKKVYNSNKG